MAVAAALSVKLVFAVRAVTRVLFAMPLPVTNMPTARPVVLAQVTVVLALVVPQLASDTVVPCTTMPTASPMVLAQVTVAVALSVQLVSAMVLAV